MKHGFEPKDWRSKRAPRTALYLIRVSSVLICGFLTGCAAYNRSALTPDSFNYTVAVDDSPMRVDQHWFGFSWQLKRGPTP